MAKILIIEENPRVAGILSSFFQKKGHEADIVGDGISAIRSFVGRNYDLLLMNLELPFMAGDAVCRKIRESARHHDIAIIMMSGVLKNEAEIETLSAELRLQGFLTKPFTSDMLMAAIEPVLNPQPAAAGEPQAAASSPQEPAAQSQAAEEALPVPDPDPVAVAEQTHQQAETASASAEEHGSSAAAAPEPGGAGEPKSATTAKAAAPAELPPRAQQAPPPRTAAVPPAPAAPRQPPPMKGSLATTAFEKVLFYLLKKKGTGILTIMREDRTRIFYFLDGGALDVETVSGDDDFGAFLKQKGLAEDVELRQYRELRQQGGDPRDLFIKMGCLTPNRFLDESRLFLQDRLADCFTWTSGTVLFEWSPSFMKGLPAAAAFMCVHFYRGFRAKLTSGATSDFLEEKGRRYAARTADFYEYQNHLAGEPGSVVLDLIDGRKTCTDIVASTESDEAAVMLYTLDYLKALSYSESPAVSEVPPPFPLRERTDRQPVRQLEIYEDLGGALSALEDEVEALGAVKPAAAEPAAGAAPALSPLEQELKGQWEAIREKNYYEIFGMQKNTFSFDKMKKSYFEYTRTFGPDKFFASSSDIMAMAEEFLSRVSNAYETLSNVVSKENYDEMLSQQEQVPSETDDKEFYEQIQFQSGKVFVDQGQFDSAEKAFTNCVNIDPNKAEYVAYLALAVYNNPANRSDPAARKRAKDLVNKSLQLGKLSIAYALKGTIYLDEGGVNFAEAEFNKALRQNPNNKTALKKLAEIKAKREQEEKKGLFQRMFK